MKRQRRARVLLGTLVEISLPEDIDVALFAEGFAVITSIEKQLSRFLPESDIGRFHALAPGTSIAIHPLSARVLRIAKTLQTASAGLFDVSQGTGPHGWELSGNTLTKLSPEVRLDLGGIAKGYAVDRAVSVLRRSGCAWGAVNAGGDLSVFGAEPVQIMLRDESGGGVHTFGELLDGSFATSCFNPQSRHQLFGSTTPASHVSVAAPRCVWADALTKIVAASGNIQHPLVKRCHAQAWLHEFSNH